MSLYNTVPLKNELTQFRPDSTRNCETMPALYNSVRCFSDVFRDDAGSYNSARCFSDVFI